MIQVARRHFLAGLGGLLVALPFLEGLAPKSAKAAPPDRRFFIGFRQWFGVQQQARWGGTYGAEPEGFWPDAGIGPNQSIKLTKELLQKGQNGSLRATGELAEFAESLLLLRGVRLMDFSVQLHRQNLVQVMTGSHFQPTRPGFSADDPNNAWPLHESLDHLFSRTVDGSKPLVFEAITPASQASFDNGQNGGLPNEIAALRQPSAAFAQLFTKASEDAQAQALRLSATDAVAAEIKTLRTDPRLSAQDKIRLDQHFEAMNAIETKLSCLPPVLGDPKFQPIVDSDAVKTSDLGLPKDQQKRIWEASGNFNEHAETVTEAFLTILSLGASCGAFRAANISLPAPTNFDHSDIFQPGTAEHDQGFAGHYHPISHRSFTDTQDNDPSLGGAAVEAHHRIDRWHGRKFAKLLGQLRDYGILDDGLTVWTNEICHGNHTSYDMPYVIAGSAGGKLVNGQYFDLQNAPVEDSDSAGDQNQQFRAIMKKQTPNSKVLNTLGAALGLKSQDGTPLADFGGFQRGPEQEPMERVLGNLPGLLKL
jgi:hypothetical protein